MDYTFRKQTRMPNSTTACFTGIKQVDQQLSFSSITPVGEESFQSYFEVARTAIGCELTIVKVTVFGHFCSARMMWLL